MHKTDLIWGGTWGAHQIFEGACAPPPPSWQRHWTLADFDEGRHTILYIQIRIKLKQKFQLYKYYGIYKYACAIELLYHLHELRISLIEFRFTQMSFR